MGGVATGKEENERKAMRKRVLAEWRGVWAPRDTSSYTRTTGELVPVLMKKLGVADRLAEEKLAGAWRKLVGEFIAQHSRPVKLERRTLIVAVSQPAVMYTLERDLKRQVVAKLKKELGESVLRAVRFVAG